MTKKYYGRIGGDREDYYMWLILVDENFACYYTNPKIPWTLQPDNAFLDVPEDITSYDSLTEEEALSIAKKWGN